MTANTISRIDELILISRSPADSSAFVDACLPSLNPGATSEDFASVRFVDSAPPDFGVATPQDRFWKFSVFVDDLDAVRSDIERWGIPASEPVQLGDIGYLCHLTEPGGIEIELLQRTFLATVKSAAPRLAGLGLITLRVEDRAASVDFYTRTLEMSALAEMAVADGRPDPFDLLFFAPTIDDAPFDDPSHVGNREWLYQRPYTVIELQHYRAGAPEFGSDQGCGLAAVGVTSTGPNHTSPDGHHFLANP